MKILTKKIFKCKFFSTKCTKKGCVSSFFILWGKVGQQICYHKTLKSKISGPISCKLCDVQNTRIINWWHIYETCKIKGKALKIVISDLEPFHLSSLQTSLPQIETVIIDQRSLHAFTTNSCHEGCLSLYFIECKAYYFVF